MKKSFTNPLPLRVLEAAANLSNLQQGGPERSTSHSCGGPRVATPDMAGWWRVLMGGARSERIRLRSMPLEITSSCKQCGTHLAAIISTASKQEFRCPPPSD